MTIKKGRFRETRNIDEEKQNINTTQYVLGTNIYKQTQITWNSERKDI